MRRRRWEKERLREEIRGRGEGRRGNLVRGGGGKFGFCPSVLNQQDGEKRQEGSVAEGWKEGRRSGKRLEGRKGEGRRKEEKKERGTDQKDSEGETCSEGRHKRKWKQKCRLEGGEKKKN